MEFYTFNDELWCIKEDGKNEKFTETDTEIISWMINIIQSRYPLAYNALEECYEKSQKNATYYQYLIVRRFIKCNFGELDFHKEDISKNNINFEEVRCPLRGECKYEGVICKPTFNSNLSTMELRVMKELFDGKEISEIASELYISPNTVKNHIRNSYAKLGIHEKAEFVKYAIQHSLFEG